MSRCSLHKSRLCLEMRELISEFNSESMGSQGLFVRVVSLCDILIVICSGRSLQLLGILPLGICFLSACSKMWVKIVFAMCGLVGGVMFVKAVSVSFVKFSQSAFL